MKFTDGYWCVKKGITPLYAAEYSSHKVKDIGVCETPKAA